MLDELQALGEKCRVAVVKLDVVSGSGSDFESDGLTDDEGDGLRLGLAYDFRGDRTPLGAMEEFMRDLMHKRAELFGFGLTGQQRDPAAVAHAQRGRDVLRKGKLDPLPLYECEEAFTIFAYVAADFAYGGKLFAFGLRDIEHIGISESGSIGRFGCVLVLRSSFCLRLVMMGARMRMPRSPFFTLRP